MMKIVCSECKHEVKSLKSFIVDKEYKIENERKYCKEKYECPNCKAKSESDWLIES